MMAKRRVSRREFLRRTGAAGVGILGAARRARGDVAAAVAKKPFGTPRPDLVDKDSPPGLQVIQLTNETDVPASHVHMEAQIFTPISGQRLISDAGPFGPDGRVFLARFTQPGKDPLGDFQHLLKPRCSWHKGAHVHPFLSPDGSMGFFDSDESGILQAYLVRGWMA